MYANTISTMMKLRLLLPWAIAEMQVAKIFISQVQRKYVEFRIIEIRVMFIYIQMVSRKVGRPSISISYQYNDSHYKY